MDDPSAKRKREPEQPVVDDSASKRAGKGSGSVSQRPNPLHALLTLTESRHQMPQQLMSMLSMDDAVALSRVSVVTHAAVQTHSALSQMQGKRSVSGTSFWSTDPQASDKRYFKPMSAVGATASVPHLSEQRGFDSHLTDVASMPFASGLGSLPSGNYPGKVQFPVVGGGPGGPHLGPIDVPVNPAKGRVLVQAPPISGEPHGTFIETKSFNKASKGPLPPSYPRTHLSPAQVAQPLSTVRTKWEGKEVKSMERPAK